MPRIRPVLLALFIGFSAFGQGKAVPLKIILADIGLQHHVTFNYIEDEVAVYALVPPPKDWPLTTEIDYIKKRTRLEFKAIGNDSYTVYNDKKLDKPLCGFILDAVTGMPVEAVSAIISGSGRSAISDAKGYFELPVISSATIVFKHQNYQPLTVDPAKLYTPGCPDILLVPIVNTLPEIVAQRYLTTGISKNIDGTYRVTPKNFGILPGLNEPDVQQTMQQLPGINSEDETITNISVRGGTHDQNLFLWNGIRMFQTGHFFGLISAFNPALPQTISISKNGTSAFFGESVSSLVDISTYSKNIDSTRTAISADMISVQCASNIKLSDKSSIGFSARRSYVDKLSTPTYRNFRNRIFQNTVVTSLSDDQTIDVDSDEHFYFYDFTGQYRRQFGRHTLSVDGIAITNSLIIDQVSDVARKNNDLGQHNYGFSAHWTSDWNSRNHSDFSTYVSYYSLHSSTEDFSDGQLLEQKNTVLDKGFRFSHLLKTGGLADFNFGYQFNETGVTSFDQINSPAFSRNITNVLHTHAAIAEAVIGSEDKNRFLKAGVRLNYLENMDVFLPEIRLQFSQKISGAFRLEVLGEEKSQTLSQVIDKQQDFLGIEKRRWILADGQNNPVQKSDQLSIGLTFKKDNWLVTVDNFYKQVRGITTSEQGFQNQFEFTSATGSYRVLGSELLVQKNFGKFYSWLNYSINDNQYTFDSLVPKHFANNFELAHAISAAAVYEWRTLKIALGGKWHSGRPITTPSSAIADTTDPTNPQVLYNSPNNTRLPDFVQVSFSVAKEWKIGKNSLQLGASVVNLLNTHNVVSRYFRVGNDGISVNRIDTFALERTPNLNLKFLF